MVSSLPKFFNFFYILSWPSGKKKRKKNKNTFPNSWPLHISNFSYSCIPQCHRSSLFSGGIVTWKDNASKALLLCIMHQKDKCSQWIGYSLFCHYVHHKIQKCMVCFLWLNVNKMHVRSIKRIWKQEVASSLKRAN